jgi:hypothetical protein
MIKGMLQAALDGAVYFGKLASIALLIALALIAMVYWTQ